jgi:hypothetical protein
MHSQLQIEASRQNSQLSTGPRSETGKAISCMNSLKTGIYAQAEIIPGENPADLEALTTEYYQRYQPDKPDTRCLVDILVQSEWTLRRLRRAEAQLWARLFKETESSFKENTNPLGRAANYQGGKPFERLQHRFDVTQRNYARTLKQLKELQPNPPAQPVPVPVPAPAPELVAEPALEPDKPVPVGFESSNSIPALPVAAQPIGFVPQSQGGMPLLIGGTEKSSHTALVDHRGRS